MSDKELLLIRYILTSFNQGYTSDTFRWEISWSPVMEKLLREAGEQYNFTVTAEREKEWMNPDYIVIYPFSSLVDWAINRLKEGELNEINRKTGTGILRVDMPIGDPNRIGTERL